MAIRVTKLEPHTLKSCLRCEGSLLGAPPPQAYVEREKFVIVDATLMASFTVMSPEKKNSLSALDPGTR